MRDSISMCMMVRCCEGYKEVRFGDIGRVMKVGVQVQVPLLVVLSGDVTQVLGHCCLCTLCHEYCVCLFSTTMILLTPTHIHSYKSLCCIVLSIAVSFVLVIIMFHNATTLAHSYSPLIQVDSDGLQDLNVQANWQQKRRVALTG